MKPFNRRGFTLIELLITISILAIISAIGFSSYSQSQLIARDGKRKNDLRAIATALEVYYQQNNNTYPTTTTANPWVNSFGSSPWITSTPAFAPNYINSMPVDPKNSCGSATTNPRDSSNCYVYAYCNSDGATCGLGPANPGYFLTTRLENTNDPLIGKAVNGGSATIVTWPTVASPCTYCFTVGNP